MTISFGIILWQLLSFESLQALREFFPVVGLLRPLTEHSALKCGVVEVYLIFCLQVRILAFQLIDHGLPES